MTSGTRFDVVVVGASIAGCTAARLFARAGARVALVERRPDPDAYKVACTHQILSSAAPTIERLGLGARLERRGAVRSLPAAWTPYGGWMRFPAGTERGFGVTRRTLDPMLRNLAADTAGVELVLGQAVVGLLGPDATGVEIEGGDRRRRRLVADLVVGADGRHSAVARLAGIRGRVGPNRRFFYFAYWTGLEPVTDRARLWFLDPDVAAVFPNEDGLTLVAIVPQKAALRAFRADLEGAYRRAVAAIPQGPDLAAAERRSKLIGALDAPNVLRPPVCRGVALVGDAALASDPVFGVGCGWAFQTAEWLVEETAPAVVARAGLDAALARYRRRFLRRLLPHHLQIVNFSSRRRLRFDERIVFRAAASDPKVARGVEEVTTRRRSPLLLLDPRLGARVARASIRKRLAA